LPSDELSADQVIAIVSGATTEEELRTAIHVAAAFLRTHEPDDKLAQALAELITRIEAAGLRFGRPHEG
jgi:hypothetical protein